ncbi:MAG: TonB-dependent receptor plug domain-containing protein [Acidobacteriota bacterium]
MLRVLVVIAACVAVADAAPARPERPERVVHGVVMEQGTTRPIVGATIYTDRGELATSDADGYFAIDVTADDREVTVAATGYAARAVALPEGDLPLHVELATTGASEVIEVVGKAPEQTHPISYQLTQDEIREIPGGGNDVLRATQVLPGVARIPYSFGGLVLRGTSPRDTAVYLDGVEVPIAFHFGGITSFYPSAMLGDLELVPGNFEAAYGHAQGGLVTLTTREPRTDRWRVGGQIGLLDSGVMAEGPVKGGGIIIGVRRSYFDTVAGPFVSADIPLPSYWDAQVRASFGDPTRQGRITPMVFLSIDRVATNDPSANDGRGIAITQMFVRAAVPYVRAWGALTLHVVPWLGTNRLTFEDNDNASHTQESFTRPVYPAGVRADLTRDYVWGHLRGGLDSEGGYLSQQQVGFTGAGDGPAQMNGSTTTAWADLALWGEARVLLDGERFAVKPGVRVERYGLTGELVVDPRLNIHQKLSEHWTLRQAIGRYHQPPTAADVDPVNGNPKLVSSYMDQMSLGVDADVARDTTVSLTGFYEYGRDIAVREPTHNPGDDYEPNFGGLGPTFELLLEKQLGFSFYRDNVGRAHSEGLELLVKRATKRSLVILAYTLSKADRVDNPALTLGVKHTGYLWRPFELDQRHNLNLAGSYQLAHWRLGARVQLVSGNPYSPTIFTNNQEIQYPWAGTLPWFFQLDVRADRRWHRCWGDVNLFFDIQNVTNRRNVEGRDYSESDRMDRDVPGLPIVPFIGVELVPK